MSVKAEKDEIYVDMAMEYEHNQNFTGAIKVLNEALSHNPHNEFALSELSYCYEKEEKEEEAIHKITQLLMKLISFSAWYHLEMHILDLKTLTKRYEL